MTILTILTLTLALTIDNNNERHRGGNRLHHRLSRERGHAGGVGLKDIYEC